MALFAVPISSELLPSIRILPSNVCHALDELLSSVNILLTPLVTPLIALPIPALTKLAPNTLLNKDPVFCPALFNPSSESLIPFIPDFAFSPVKSTSIFTLPTAIFQPPFLFIL